MENEALGLLSSAVPFTLTGVFLLKWQQPQGRAVAQLFRISSALCQ